MSYTVKENAHTILLPAFANTQLSDAVKRFLSNGGKSILVGETREEYVAREMSLQRRMEETAETIMNLTSRAASLTGNVLVAVDHEIAGICRLHKLVPSFPEKGRIAEYSSNDFEALSAEIAIAAKALGINCFLGPILDIVTGKNPWLDDRTWSNNPVHVAKISSAYIRGLQANGIAATAKHFPGYSHIPLDPAVDSEARITQPEDSFASNFIPFADAIDSGVEIIMTGPAIVEAFDPERPASISPSIIRLLRQQFAFKGVIMSDDLDAKATLRGRPIPEIAVKALNAGTDLLMIADIDNHIDQVIEAIITAVDSGKTDRNRLNEAAKAVRSLAVKYG